MSSPMARPSDVAMLDAILQALYDVISGPAGQELTACRINDCSGQI